MVLLATCAAIASPQPTTTAVPEVTLIPSTVVTVAPTTTATVFTTFPIVPTETGTSTTTVTFAPPTVTSVPTTAPVTTRAPTLPTSPPITVPSLTAVFSAPAEQAMFAYMNLLRTSVGLPELVDHPDLNFYARVWAGKMAAANDLTHSNVGGLLGPWMIVGENVGVGSTINDIFPALVDSPTHYAVMTDPLFTYTGIGVAVDPAGRLWVCQVFGGTKL